MSDRFRKKLRQGLSGFLAFVMVFFNVAPVSAGLFSGPKLPSTSSLFSDMEDRYHLDTESIQTQAESFNVGDNKKLTPEVSLFFTPTDPKDGEKITARAFPVLFSNETKNLYYTWFLKRKGCDLDKNPKNPDILKRCDDDKDNRITIEDWKIKAMRILAQHNFEKDEVDDYDSLTDNDNDGYQARYGGDNRINTPDHCYIGDPITGKNYELLADDASVSDTTFDCTGTVNTEPVCLEGELQIDPGTIDVDPTAPTSSPAFSFTQADICHRSGTPICSKDGTVRCDVGAPRCVAKDATTSCGDELLTCTPSETKPGNTACQHLFPNAPGRTTGDGSFGKEEEAFWGTNPQDPDTAENGNKDEANVVGLGRETLTWNYIAGDKIGVAVEGNATTNTKYADSSFMIMWAFSKKNCQLPTDPGKIGSITKRIKKYDVVIPTVKMDLNRCIGYLDGSGKEIAPNLVDPTEGGQATSLEVDVSATPNELINDESIDEAGDTVSVLASLSNGARDVNNVLYEWDVAISKEPQFSDPPTRITEDLQKLGLLGNVKGLALESLRLSLNIPNKDDKLLAGEPLAAYLNESKIGYLKFSVKVSESFADKSVRKGKSDVIVKFTSTGDKIIVHRVRAVPTGTTMRVERVPATDVGATDGRICNGNKDKPAEDKDRLDRTSCRVIKNEILGLYIDPTGLTNFHWTINGKELLCKQSIVSSECEENEQNNINFFPVTGDVGDSYTVTVSANEVATDKKVTLTRSFHVVQPLLSIDSINGNTAWPKLLGAYRDVSTTNPSEACPGGLCPDYSKDTFEGIAGETLAFKGVFMPNFLANRATRQWMVDGAVVAESGNVTGGSIAFAALKEPSDLYNISLKALVVQPQDIRQALRDIWGVSQLDSPEITFSVNAQVELRESGLAQGTLPGMKKYLAAIASYVPASFIFFLRVALAIFLLIFTTNVLYALLPERAALPGFFRRQ